MMTYYVCHFEDQPELVDLPNMIEAGLFASRKFSRCTIDSSEWEHTIILERDAHTIILKYIIRRTFSEMMAAIPIAERTHVIATLIDMYLGHDRESGAQIAYHLHKKEEEQWQVKQMRMLTAYPVEAQLKLAECSLDRSSVAVISKPANLRSIRDEIVQRFLVQLSIQMDQDR